MQLRASCLPEPPWQGENKDFTCVGAWWAPVTAPGTSLCSSSKRCVRTLRASERGAEESPASRPTGKCPQGQGCSALLLRAFPRVTMPRSEEEFGCQNPQCGIRAARAVRRRPRAPIPGDGLRPRFGHEAQAPCSLPSPRRHSWLQSVAVSRQGRRRLPPGAASACAGALSGDVGDVGLGPRAGAGEQPGPPTSSAYTLNAEALYNKSYHHLFFFLLCF